MTQRCVETMTVIKHASKLSQGCGGEKEGGRKTLPTPPPPLNSNTPTGTWSSPESVQ